MVKDETQSVRISKDVVRVVKIVAAEHGLTIRQILEKGAQLEIAEIVYNGKKRKGALK